MNSFPYSASIIIPNWNGMKWLPGCLAALQDQGRRDFEVIIVDNGSSDGSVPFIRESYPGVTVIELERNFGFSIAVNAGIRAAKGRYIILLNNDTLPEKEWLSALLLVVERSPSGVGSLASHMVSMDNPAYTDDAGDLLDWRGFATKRGHETPVSLWTTPGPVFSACAGAALYRREFIGRTGLFDEKFGSYLEDIDIGLRGNLFGFRCVFVPDAIVLHKGHGSGIPSGEYVYHITKNRIMLFVKNMPLKLLIRHTGTILLGQVYAFFVYKKPLITCRAYLYVLRNLRAILRDRAAIVPQISLTEEEIDSLLQRPAEA